MQSNNTQAVSDQVDETTQKWRDAAAKIGMEEAQEILDDLVHSAFEGSAACNAPDPFEDEWEQHYDGASKEASDINNNGADAQIHWLVQNGYKLDIEAAIDANI